MSKPAAIFVAAAMAVTAACVAVIASYGLNVTPPIALLVGLGALALMAVTHLAFTRAAPAADGRVDDIDRLATDLQSRLETVEARLSTLDGAAAERARSATRPLVEEIAALGGLVTTIAKEVAAHDVAIEALKDRRLREQPAAAVAAAAREPMRPAYEPVRHAPPAASPARLQVPEPFDLEEEAAPRVEDGLARRIERALAEDRIEPHLQPIVSLPSRRVTHYEALARLIEGDRLLTAAEFLPAAVERGLMAAIDRRTLDRCGSVALRLSARGSGAVFVNVSADTFASPDARAAVAAMFEDQRELCRLFVLEMSIAAFGALPPEARGALEKLVGEGVRLSLDGAIDLRFDPREFARRGVRFVKIEAARLLDPEAARGAAIHPADMSGLLARHAVDLIATHVEDERTVPELLDMDVRLAQGRLFGVPRPVRPAVPEAAVETAAKRPPPGRLVPRSAGAR